MLKRRDFLLFSAGGVAYFFLPTRAAWAAREQTKWLILGSGTDFVRIDLTTSRRETVSTPTKAHSFTILPGEPNQVLGIEKWDRRLSHVDFAKKRLVRSVEPVGKRNFYGHVCWDPQGRHFISPQMDPQTARSYLVWYDRDSFKAVDEVELTLGGCHDLAVLPGTDLLAVTSSGLAQTYDNPHGPPVKRVGPSAIIFYDMKKRKVAQRHELGRSGVFPGHLRVGSAGQVYFLTSMAVGEKGPVSGGIYDTNLTQAPREWIIPESFRTSLIGEFLSIEIDEKLNRLVASNPTSRQLLTFDLTTRGFLSATSSASSGIAWDGERAILYGFEPGASTERIEKMDGFTFRRLVTAKMSSHILLVHGSGKGASV